MAVASDVLITVVMTKSMFVLSFAFVVGLAGPALASPVATTSFDPRFCTVAAGRAATSDAGSWSALGALGVLGAVAMRRRRR
jgi:MYXO-CTERM domain-containing protein